LIAPLESSGPSGASPCWTTIMLSVYFYDA
jgi:hypothetical protein